MTMAMSSPPVSHPDSDCSVLGDPGQSEKSHNVMSIPVTVSNGDDESRRERLVRWTAENAERVDSVDSSFAVLVSPGNGGVHQVHDEEIGSNGSSCQFDSSCKERKLVDEALAEYTRQLQARISPKVPAGCNEERKSAADIRDELRRTEGKIFKAARIELDLLNRSKKIRSTREVLTRRYKRLCLLLEAREKEECGEANRDSPFVPARLPPVMPQQVYDLTETAER